MSFSQKLLDIGAQLKSTQDEGKNISSRQLDMLIGWKIGGDSRTIRKYRSALYMYGLVYNDNDIVKVDQEVMNRLQESVQKPHP